MDNLAQQLDSAQGQETRFLRNLVETVVRLEKKIEHLESIVVRKIKVEKRDERKTS